MRGKFITFEGPEGCGKSTQSKLLYNHLKKKGYDVVFLREPGSTKIGEEIRKILLDPANKSMSALCETLLYMASRSQVMDTVIKPSLKKGKIVICDRFLDSTIVYQGYGLGLDLGSIKFIGDFVTGGIRPDLTILLDQPVKKGLRHRQWVKDRIEQRSLPYHERVRRGYLKIASCDTRRIKVVRLDDHKEKTQADIRALVDRFLEG